MKFEDFNLKKQYKKALTEIGYEIPTSIQEKSFSVIKSGIDVVGIAQTGTGKTIAYLLPILEQLSYSVQYDPRVLILVPTRELVEQVKAEIDQLTQFVSIRVSGVYGGTNINTQKAELLQGVDVVVATPGRLFDLVSSGNLKLKFIQKFVIDEMDEMLNLGFRTQIKLILDLLPEKRQNLLFSATINEDVESLIENYFNTPTYVEAAPSGTPLEKIEQEGYWTTNFNTKINFLQELIQDKTVFNRVLIFTQSRAFADKVFDRINSVFEDEIGAIHSNKSQNYRFGTLKKFANRELRILIATDLVARGLDISDVSHVINFDMPTELANYIHRIGRTGRAEKEGFAISFFTEKDKTYKTLLEEYMQRTIQMKELPESIEISEELIPEEIEEPKGKLVLTKASIKHSQGAFHEKKVKNKKVNLGNQAKLKQKAKYKKPKTRGQKK